MRASRPASRVARVVGPRHPITLTLPPLGLDLGLASLAVEAVSAGPVWDVSRYLATDGSVYLTAPAMDLSGQYEIVAVWSRSSTGVFHMPWGTKSTGFASRLRQLTTTALHGVAMVVADVYRAATLDPVSQTGDFCDFAPLVNVGGGAPWEARLQRGAGAMAVADAPSSLCHEGDVELLLAAAKFPTNLARSASGMLLRWVGVRAAGTLSAGSRTAIAGAPLADPRGLSSESFAYLWSMGNVYDAGSGVYKVRDLITTDGTTDATVVSGDLGDFPEA